MAKKTDKKCCVCGQPFSCSYQGQPYCNKHWLRMYNNGTIEPKPRKRTNEYKQVGDKLLITTSKKQTIIVDFSDYNILSKFSWSISKTGYAVANVHGKTTKMHRYILGITSDKTIIDHINGNPLDNRRANLRICNCIADNARNCKVRKNNTSGVTGVQKIKKTGKFRVRITVNRKEIRLGNYDKFEDAVKARIEAEKKYFGEYAPCVCRTNNNSEVE